MGASWSITGRWRGSYTYDRTPENPQPGPAVPFRLQVKQGWFGRFSGSVEDDPARGTPEMSTVQGTISGDQVEFLKHLPVFYVPDGARLLNLREYLESQCNLTLDRDVPPPPIRYHGRYDASTCQVAGTWRTGGGIVQFTSRGRLYDYPVPAATGTWHMTRDEPG
jgi:hypothetical protein